MDDVLNMNHAKSRCCNCGVLFAF